jgi:hypothetical protein
MKYAVSFYILFSAFLSACGGSDHALNVTVAKSVDSVQCVSLPASLEQLDADLASANITPTQKSCAWDGKIPFGCGAKVSYFRVIEIPSDQMDKASTLGYKSLDNFSKLSTISCPAT